MNPATPDLDAARVEARRAIDEVRRSAGDLATAASTWASALVNGPDGDLYQRAFGLAAERLMRSLGTAGVKVVTLRTAEAHARRAGEIG